jgi:hypothetical protein
MPAGMVSPFRRRSKMSVLLLFIVVKNIISRAFSVAKVNKKPFPSYLDQIAFTVSLR